MEENRQSSLPDRDAVMFIHQIRKELSLPSSKEAVRMIASVLHAMRQTLPLEKANQILNELPDFLKLTFATNWEHNEKLVHINHLDELVTLVMDRDARSKRGLFRNEVQTLSVIILTLKKLQRMVDLENFDGLSPALRQELHGLSAEAAA
jgi:Uncharacterized conserved protein